MKLLARIFFITSISVGASLHARASDDGLYFNWLNSYSEGLRQAEITGKPILLSFRCVP